MAVPVTYRRAVAFIEEHHRHHRAPRGQVFAIGVAVPGENEEPQLVGVATAGRPVSRMLADGFTLEVTRVATDGTRNACSFLYGAVRRAGKAMGYRRFITYTLPEEGGASLRAAGWEEIAKVRAQSWTRESRPREEQPVYLQEKLRWEAT